MNHEIRKVTKFVNSWVKNGDGYYPVLKRYLLILSVRILESSVEGGRPSLAAAPEGPDTRPSASASAASIAFVSSDADILENSLAAWSACSGSRESQLSSTVKF